MRGADEQRALADREGRLGADADEARLVLAPIAKEGWVPMPMRPGSCWRHALKLRPASDVSVVQLCPVGGTYCRSSSQIVHRAGGLSLGGYCTPQAVQMKASMDQTTACWRGCYLAAGAARIACHTRSGVAGMSMWRMP